MGLFITIIADFFLLFIKSQYILGVGLFCIVQILYNIRYKGEYNRNIIYRFGILFILLFLTYIIVDNFIIEMDFLIVISIYYAVCLLSNIYQAINLLNSHIFPKVNSKTIVLGMILFLLCDINVVIFNILKTINISSPVLLFFNKLSYISMWLFYLPSQILLSLSGYNNLEKHI